MRVKILLLLTVYLQSCNTNNKNSADELALPERIEFKYVAKGRVDIKENNGIEKASHGITVISISERDKTIRFSLNAIGYKGEINFYWTRTQTQNINTDGTVKKGVAYIGKDEEGQYTEVEFFYNAENKIETVILRTNSNTEILLFMNTTEIEGIKPAKNTEEVYESIKKVNGDNSPLSVLIGCWFVRHSATIQIKFKSDNTFTFNDYNERKNQEETINGIYEFKGSVVILKISNRPERRFELYNESRDGFYYLKAKGYLFAKLDDCD